MGSARSFHPEGTGPFRVAHLRPGDPYELSDGHAIVAEPAGHRHGRRHLTAAAIVDSDPAVDAAAVDAGFVLSELTMRAPDVAVGNLGDQPSYGRGAPALAIEYAEAGGDEADLERKIAQLLASGTQAVWVVRLGGARRVEVHRPGQAVVVRRGGEEITAPGTLRNPVPIDALYDRRAAHETVLRNLLQRRGYESLAALRDKERAQGRAEGEARGLATGALEHARRALRGVLEARGLVICAAEEASIDACTDLSTLDLWLRRAITAAAAGEVCRPG